MNKRTIDSLIPKAYAILEKVEIAKNGEIQKVYKTYISSFGASIVQGSLISAIAFFREKGEAQEDRTKLLTAIFQLITDSSESKIKDLSTYVMDKVKNENTDKFIKEDIINASISLKLAMNLYKLIKNKEKENE